MLSLTVLLLAERCYHFADKFGHFREIQILHPGICKVLEGDYYGAEDLAALPSGEILASTGGMLQENLIQKHRHNRRLSSKKTKIQKLNSIKISHHC